MTIEQYEAEFARLSKYAPRMVDNPLDKARRFRDGLQPDLRSQLVALDLQNYEELYRRGQPIERDMRERRKMAPGPRFVPRRDNRNFGKRPMMNNRRFVPPVKKGIGKPTRSNNWNCRLCGRRHGNGPCPGRGGACFRCGKMGHHVRQCTEKAPGDFPQMVRPQGGPQIGVAPQGSQNRPPAQGRVYAVARKDAENAPGVVTELKPLEVVLHVATPLKNEALGSLGCQNCKIVIGDSEELIDLAVLPMYDFDVIVGMDWLGKLKAVVDCGSRAIQFFPVGRPRFDFVGSRGGTSIPLISSLEIYLDCHPREKQNSLLS
ncbi:uncharacterized protein LOC115732906 [Rhodamnia argentea]|uniref:Uncharacterized protein LOC115732906 n=1 Tax=Rhodamnia argentea TaxID=178133 RepID=A0A8B8NAI9_9MYRT|nr:uncharacterized protein LOC115732906 [Rhodamnia argentea]